MEEALLLLEYAITDLALAKVALPEPSKYELLLFHVPASSRKGVESRTD